jgi:tRNA(His) guanylyltransferase
MKFGTLKEKCEYYRGLTDYRLVPNSYIIAMVDGHCFSKMIKNKFKKPFDDDFINMMNETAKYLCENIQGAKMAYVQSDEISVLITDFDTPETDSFFGFRLCKMQSLIAAMATAKFNQMYSRLNVQNKNNEGIDYDKDLTLCTFDAKVWQVPTYNDAFGWFLYRQNDCKRNSKQQTAQTYLPHKVLCGHSADEQVAMALEQKGVDWGSFDDGKKYGRLIYREHVYLSQIVNNRTVVFDRNQWRTHPATPFGEDGNKIKELIPKRNGSVV